MAAARAVQSGLPPAGACRRNVSSGGNLTAREKYEARKSMKREMRERGEPAFSQLEIPTTGNRLRQGFLRPFTPH